MRWLGLLSALLVISSGCNSTPDVPSKIDIAKPAGDIEQKSQCIQDNASQLSGKLDNLSHEVKAPGVDTDTPEAEATAPEIELKPHVQQIERDAEDIEATAGTLIDIQPKIDKQSKELQKEQAEDEREVQHLWNWLQIAGIVIAGLGGGLAGWFLGPSAGVLFVASGLGLSAAAKFWQDYWWIPVGAIGVAFLFAFCYVCYRLWLARDTLLKEYAGIEPGQAGKKEQAEVKHKAEKKKRKLEKKKNKLQTKEPKDGGTEQ